MAEALANYGFQPWQALFIGVLVVAAGFATLWPRRAVSGLRIFRAHEISEVFEDWSEVVLYGSWIRAGVNFWEFTDGENRLTYSCKPLTETGVQTECIEVSVPWAGPAIYDFQNRGFVALRRGDGRKEAGRIADSVTTKIDLVRKRLRNKVREHDQVNASRLGVN